MKKKLYECISENHYKSLPYSLHITVGKVYEGVPSKKHTGFINVKNDSGKTKAYSAKLFREIPLPAKTILVESKLRKCWFKSLSYNRDLKDYEIAYEGLGYFHGFYNASDGDGGAYPVALVEDNKGNVHEIYKITENLKFPYGGQ